MAITYYAQARPHQRAQYRSIHGVLTVLSLDLRDCGIPPASPASAVYRIGSPYAHRRAPACVQRLRGECPEVPSQGTQSTHTGWRAFACLAFTIRSLALAAQPMVRYIMCVARCTLHVARTGLAAGAPRERELCHRAVIRRPLCCTPLTSAPGLGSPPPTSAPGLGSPPPTAAPGRPHLRRDCAPGGFPCRVAPQSA